jgi:hypothetical protein
MDTIEKSGSVQRVMIDKISGKVGVCSCVIRGTKHYRLGLVLGLCREGCTMHVLEQSWIAR